MLQAALNGGHAAEMLHVPISPEDLAQSAKGAVQAGASALHVHPRDAAGAESLAAEHVGAALTAIRGVVPEVPLGIGTGAWITPHRGEKYAQIAGWEVLPDYVSINLNEEDAPKMFALMDQRGIGIEAGIWTRHDAARFMDELGAPPVLRLLIEVQDVGAAEAETEAHAIMEMLADHPAPKLLHGEERSAWPMQHLAAKLDLDTRIGFEDTFTLPDGSPAPSNAALVRAALEIRQAA